MLTQFRNNILNFLAPAMCAYCKVLLPDRTLMCAPCKALITPVVSKIIPVSARYEVKVFAVSAYQEPLKSLILAKRWSDICASTQLGTLMWEMTNIKHVPVDLFVPLPLHWTRYARRGFNQADEIARQLSRLSGKPTMQILKRVKRTRFQSELSPQQRQRNVSDAFELAIKNDGQFNGKHIVLIDDLMTTGSTLHAAACELVKLKPASISALVACRVV